MIQAGAAIPKLIDLDFLKTEIAEFIPNDKNEIASLRTQ
jgi:hypothetical protein